MNKIKAKRMPSSQHTDLEYAPPPSVSIRTDLPITDSDAYSLQDAKSVGTLMDHHLASFSDISSKNASGLHSHRVSNCVNQNDQMYEILNQFQKRQ